MAVYFKVFFIYNPIIALEIYYGHGITEIDFTVIYLTK